MIPGKLERLRIAGLVVALPPDVDLRDPDLLEAHLGPFAWRGEGDPDVVVEDGAAGRVDPAAGPDEFLVEVNRTPSTPPDWPWIRPYRLRLDGARVRVRGRLGTTLEVASAVHLGLGQILPRRGGLLLHASAVGAAGRGFVFPGPPGAGKTTAALRFEGGRVVTDERCALRRADGGWAVHAVPMWGGKYAPVAPADLPLAMVVLVRKRGPVSVRALAPAEAIGRLAPAVFHHRPDRAFSEGILEALAGLAGDVPVVELAYDLGDSFADVLVARLAGEGMPVVR